MQVVLDAGPWKIEVDPDATRHAYEAWGTTGCADECDCAYCLNFRAARPTPYPAVFLELLDLLGVDPRCECEATEFGPSKASWFRDFEQRAGAWQEWAWIYVGSFRALGRVAGSPWPEHLTIEEGFHMKPRRGFSFGLYDGGHDQAPGGPADSEPFRSNETFVVAFMAEVPWLLETPPWEPAVDST